MSSLRYALVAAVVAFFVTESLGQPGNFSTCLRATGNGKS